MTKTTNTQLKPLTLASVFNKTEPTRPVLPTPTRLLRANVSVYNAEGMKVQTARGTLIVDPVEQENDPIASTGWRQTFLMVEGPHARPGWGAWLHITAEGYSPHRSRVFVPDGETELPTVILQRITSINLRQWRGDFLGDFIQPALMYGGMPADVREQVLAMYRANAYTHLPLAVHNDYPRFPQWRWDWWDRPEQLRECCLELFAFGVEAVVVLHPRPGWSINEHLTHVYKLWPHVQDVVRMIIWGWEINDLGGEWSNGGHLLRYLDKLNVVTGGRTPIGVHFTPERWSGWPSFDGSDNSQSEYEWLKQAKQHGVTTLLYQESPDKPESDVIDRAFLLETPFPSAPGRKGIAGRVFDACKLDFVLFEFSRDVARHSRLARRAMTFPTCAGFC